MNLNIISALYFTNSQSIDVTDALSKIINENKILTHINQFTFKDNFPKETPKYLLVKYQFREKTYIKEFKDGAIISIPDNSLELSATKPNQLDLSSITLCNFCWGHPSYLSSQIWAYTQFSHLVKFYSKLFFISDSIDLTNYLNFFKKESITVIPLPRSFTIHECGKLIIKDLNQYIESDFAMIFQHDGFISNISSWEDCFLDYDYIGAPWSFYKDKVNNVGNGGFSIRSKKLLEILENDDSISEFFPEDHHICRTYGDYLKEKHSITFSPIDIARRFSVESDLYTNQFGFHSIYQLLHYFGRLSNHDKPSNSV